MGQQDCYDAVVLWFILKKSLYHCRERSFLGVSIESLTSDERMDFTKYETAAAYSGWIISPREQQTQDGAATADQRLQMSDRRDEQEGTSTITGPLSSTANNDTGGWVVSRRELVGETRLHVLSRVNMESVVDCEEKSNSADDPGIRAEQDLIAELIVIRRQRGQSKFRLCGGFFCFQKSAVDVITAETSVDFCNCLRQTALHIAVQHNNSRAVTLLLWFGANIYLSDIFGKIPEDYCQNGIPGIFIGGILRKMRQYISTHRLDRNKVAMEKVFKAIASDFLKRDIERAVSRVVL